MADDEDVRRAFARLAETDGPDDDGPDDDGALSPSPNVERPFRETIARATTAVEDVEAAARFVDAVGLDELERAVERADRSVSSRAADGREALAAFRDFRRAAAGDYFRHGRGTSLGGGDIPPSE